MVRTALPWPVGIPSSSLAGAPPLPSFTFTDPNFSYPYTQQANFTIERAVGGQRLRLSYIMTKDTQLGYRRNINVPPPWPGLHSVTTAGPGKTLAISSFWKMGAPLLTTLARQYCI